MYFWCISGRRAQVPVCGLLWAPGSRRRGAAKEPGGLAAGLGMWRPRKNGPWPSLTAPVQPRHGPTATTLGFRHSRWTRRGPSRLSGAGLRRQPSRSNQLPRSIAWCAFPGSAFFLTSWWQVEEEEKRLTFFINRQNKLITSSHYLCIDSSLCSTT